jgi:hypothetical protein
MLELLIFSKDRACQLDLLLRSIKREFAEWAGTDIVVVYTFRTSTLGCGYDSVRAAHPEFTYICERDVNRSFKEITLAAIGENPYIAFLVDDDVFKDPFTLDSPEIRRFQDQPDIMFASLRLDPGMDYVYTLDRPMKAPRFDGTVWEWTAADADWGYPMSLDGHIFRTSEILPLLTDLSFHNPNSLEFELAQRPLANPLGICFDRAKIVNLPVNRVQVTAPNRHGGDDARVLNARFLRGQQLSLDTITGVRTRSAHQELPLSWEPAQGPNRSAPLSIRARAQGAAIAAITADMRAPALRPLRRFARVLLNRLGELRTAVSERIDRYG